MDRAGGRVRGGDIALRAGRVRAVGVAGGHGPVVHPPDRSGRRRLPGAAGVEADAAGGTGHLPGDGAVGPGTGRPGQPPAGRLRAAPAVAGRVAVDACRTRARPLAPGRSEAVAAAPAAGAATGRAEERRVGTEWVSTCRSRGSP